MMAASKIVRAAGLIVYRLLDSSRPPQYLLLQHAPSKYGPGLHWTPPKGHVDPGEAELRAAFRETEEEAGINESELELMGGFEEVIEYKVKAGPKSVIYWLAKVTDPSGVTVSLSNEHQDHDWFDLSDALSLVHENMREVMRKADDFIAGQG